MFNSKASWGALAGALVAIIWLIFDWPAVLLVVGLTVLGWLIGTILDRPERVIAVLEYLQER